MGRPPEGPVKEPVYFKIQYELLGYVPGIAWDLWIQPPIEHLTGVAGTVRSNLGI